MQIDKKMYLVLFNTMIDEINELEKDRIKIDAHLVRLGEDKKNIERRAQRLKDTQSKVEEIFINLDDDDDEDYDDTDDEDEE